MCCSDYSADIVFLTVTETEYNAVQLFYEWQDLYLDGDSQHFQVTEIEKNGKKCRIVHTRVGEMGMTAASAVTMKLIYTFRPKYVIMIGIAAGVALDGIAEQMYGDVIVPDVVWNYSVGKFVSPDKAEIIYGEVGFKPRSTSLKIPEKVIEYVKKASESEKNECHVHIGPMACGSSVVANNLVLKKQIHSQLENTAGLDMESYGVVYAATNASEPKPYPIIIKSVCDFANSEKSDDFQKFAAYTSSEFAKLLVEDYLPL